MEHNLKHTDNKVDALAQHCLYLIATGKWQAGSRLPSVRTAEEAWGMNRLTIQKAFRQLEQNGLVVSRPKSGFFVSDAASLSDVTRHRYVLENLLETFREIIHRETSLSPLPVLRYLGRLEELQSREKPESTFCECTLIQAQGHAREIEQRLHMPVLPMTLEQIGGKRQNIPGHVRTLLTTHFHSSELAPLADSSLQVIPIPIEVSPNLQERIRFSSGAVFFVERDEVSASDIAADSLEIMEQVPMEIVVSQDIEQEIAHLVQCQTKPLILLSPRNWGAISESWRHSPLVQPIEFRICPTAWPLVAEAMGAVLGTL